MIEELNFISHNRWQAKHYNPINWEWDDPTVSMSRIQYIS